MAAKEVVKCKWCGVYFEREAFRNKSPEHYCSLSHSVKAQHAKRVLGPKVKHNSHGTRARYLKGCRCQMCKGNSAPCRCDFCLKANSIYSKELRKRSKFQRVIAELRAIEVATRD